MLHCDQNGKCHFLLQQFAKWTCNYWIVQTIWSFRFKISKRCNCVFLFCRPFWASNPDKFVWFILGFSTSATQKELIFVIQIPILYESAVSQVVFMINLSCLHQNTVLWNLKATALWNSNKSLHFSSYYCHRVNILFTTCTTSLDSLLTHTAMQLTISHHKSIY